MSGLLWCPNELEKGVCFKRKRVQLQTRTRSSANALACVAGGLSRCGEHGRHFVLVVDGRLRASDKMTVQGRGRGSGRQVRKLTGSSADASDGSRVSERYRTAQY